MEMTTLKVKKYIGSKRITGQIKPAYFWQGVTNGSHFDIPFAQVRGRTKEEVQDRSNELVKRYNAYPELIQQKMINENELVIEFPSAEEKYAFMEWFEKGKALDQYNDFAPKSLRLNCVASCEPGKPDNPEEYGENGWMELQ